MLTYTDVCIQQVATYDSGVLLRVPATGQLYRKLNWKKVLLLLFSALLLLYCCFTAALVHTDLQEVEQEEGAHERP